MRRCTQHLIDQHLMDINPVLAGWAKDWSCAPQWDLQRYQMLLYYVKKGTFTLVRKDGSYSVGPGQIFFISFNDRETYTQGTPDQTYDFAWVGFTGALSHRFGELPAPMEIEEDQLPHLKALRSISSHTAYELAADLLLLRSSLLDTNEPKPDYVQHVIDYIQQAYMLPLTVEGLATQVGLDRSYLSRLFRKRTGTTLQSHLQQVRLLQAKQLLLQGYNVKESAGRCGFSNDKNFHKVFLRTVGMPPKVWRDCVLQRLGDIQDN